nr:MAG TPA: hypothetical protein [Caudoviricetes sp.]
MLRSFSTPAVSHFRCLPLPSGGQVSRSAISETSNPSTDATVPMMVRTWFTVPPLYVVGVSGVPDGLSVCRHTQWGQAQGVHTNSGVGHNKEGATANTPPPHKTGAPPSTKGRGCQRRGRGVDNRGTPQRNAPAL